MPKQAVKKERPEWGDVYEETKRRFKERVFNPDEYDAVSISFSGGKDSNTVLQMALDAWDEADDWDKPIHLMHIDDEIVLPETEEFVKRVGKDPRVHLWWCCLPVKYRNGNTNEIQDGWWYPWHPEKEDQWVRDMPREYCEETDGVELVTIDHPRLQDTPNNDTKWDGEGFRLYKDQHLNVSTYLFAEDNDQPGTDEKFGVHCSCTGVRTNESLIRYQAIVARGDWIMPREDAFDRRNKECVAHPVYDWTDEDLWYAHKKFDWDYNRAYDIQRKIGLAPANMRTAHPYSEEAVKNRDFEELRYGWPNVYERAKGRVPGSHLGFELGGQMIRKTKRDDQTWRERVAEMIAQIENPKVKKMQKRRVQAAINQHSEHSTQPLHEEEKCELCQHSWAGIAGSLQKGDLKGRGGL